jgi:hypothetical protein
MRIEGIPHARVQTADRDRLAAVSIQPNSEHVDHGLPPRIVALGLAKACHGVSASQSHKGVADPP